MQSIKRIRNNIFKLLHPGNDCYCLFCNKTFGKFIHEGVKAKVFKQYTIAGGGYKINTRCPHCGSPDRARLLALFFNLRTNVFHEKTDILHISPNKSIANYLGKNSNINQIVGALEPHEFKEYNPIEIDIQKINLKDNLFDVVICCHVIEHVKNDLEAMRELHRVLKPNGFAILQVPLALDLQNTIEDKSIKTHKDRKKAYGQVDHIRLYGLDYFEKLQKAGFRVVRDNPFDNQWLNQEDLSRHRLDRIEDVIIAYKEIRPFPDSNRKINRA